MNKGALTIVYSRPFLGIKKNPSSQPLSPQARGEGPPMNDCTLDGPYHAVHVGWWIVRFSGV